MPRKRNKSKPKALQSLIEKAASSNGYALDKSGEDVHGQKRRRLRKGVTRNSNQKNHTPYVGQRTFRDVTKDRNRSQSAIATPAYLQQNQEQQNNGSCSQSKKNINAVSKNKTPRTSFNPYKDRYAPPSSAKPHRHVKMSTHVICAISENLARETCLTTMDAGSPVVLEVNKMGNGQMYAETIAFLETINPDEILLNEGRKNSQLCQKILTIFGEKETVGDDNAKITDSGTTERLTGACAMMKTVVKFVPRSYYDQNRGAELLRRIARESVYDASIVEEYILLSSSHAVLQYLQICLGVDFARNSLDICINWGGENRMAIDRSSVAHLELLANAKTGKTSNSLIGTIDCTKTTVGSRLLRTNLMSPPTRTDTINARLDLVDTFLEDEQFFYEVLEQLTALPDVERMLSHMALIPKKRGGKALFGDKRQVTARSASRGISALVCIKSALSVVPNFARVLEAQLKSLQKRDKTKTGRQNEGRFNDGNAGSISVNSNDNNAAIGEIGNDCNDSQASLSATSTDESEEKEVDGSVTIASSLLIGLGSSARGSPIEVSGRRHRLLEAILMAMKNPSLKETLDAVKDIFTESTVYSKNRHAMRHQECFALKPNTDGMMDVLRKAFLANVDDIYKLADEYAETHGFTVTVKETTARGYYLSIPTKSITTDLPPTFIQPVKTGKFINCTTEEVLSLSSRAQENVQDLLLMTHDRIQEVIDIARQRYDALASLSDAIALIDMCHSFADNVASSRLPWCRPVVTDSSKRESNETKKNEGTKENCAVGSGSVAIRNGRYAIDVSETGLNSTESSHGNFIPNDTYASTFQNFTVITGINGAGKSTYLKQLAITVILAHCGSYVPAEEAFIPIRDRLCTRIGTSDDQEHNISTFMQEMKDTAFICKNATNKSLILIDELGRATSNEDGVAIAWAVAEFLLIKRSMTFFVTHHPQLCRLADVYPNVQNQHLGAVAETDSGEIRYMHKIMPGQCQMSADYGVEMAATCGWERDVVEMARTIRRQIENKLPDEILCQKQSETSGVDFAEVRQKAESILNDLAKHLVALKASEERLNEEARRLYLQDLHTQYALPEDPGILEMMRNLLNENDVTTDVMLPLRPTGLSCVNSFESRDSKSTGCIGNTSGFSTGEIQSDTEDFQSERSINSEVVIEPKQGQPSESDETPKMADRNLLYEQENDTVHVHELRPCLEVERPLHARKIPNALPADEFPTKKLTNTDTEPVQPSCAPGNVDVLEDPLCDVSSCSSRSSSSSGSSSSSSSSSSDSSLSSSSASSSSSSSFSSHEDLPFTTSL